MSKTILKHPIVTMISQYITKRYIKEKWDERTVPVRLTDLLPEVHAADPEFVPCNLKKLSMIMEDLKYPYIMGECATDKNSRSKRDDLARTRIVDIAELVIMIAISLDVEFDREKFAYLGNRILPPKSDDDSENVNGDGA